MLKYKIVTDEKFKDFPLFEAETLQECIDFLQDDDRKEKKYLILYPDGHHMSWYTL